MDFVITRTSTDTITVKSFSTLEELLRFKEQEKNPVIISNNFYKDIPIHSVMEGTNTDENTAAIISKCKYEIEIYDYYRE